MENGHGKGRSTGCRVDNVLKLRTLSTGPQDVVSMHRILSLWVKKPSSWRAMSMPYTSWTLSQRLAQCPTHNSCPTNPEPCSLCLLLSTPRGIMQQPEQPRYWGIYKDMIRCQHSSWSFAIDCSRLLSPSSPLCPPLPPFRPSRVSPGYACRVR